MSNVSRIKSAVPRGIFFDLAFAFYMMQALSKITYIGAEVIDLSGLAVLVPVFCLLQELSEGPFTGRGAEIAVFFFLFTIIQILFGGRNLIALFLLLYVSRNLPIRHIYSVMGLLLVLSMALTILLAKCDVITNLVAYRANSSVARYGLGFVGWTYASYFPFVIASVYALKSKENANWLIIALLCVVNFWVYSQTNTRNGFFLTFGVLILLIFKKFKSAHSVNRIRQRGLFTYMAIRSYVLAFIAFAILVAWYFGGGELIERVDSLFSLRLSMTSEALVQYGISPFGTVVDWGTSGCVVDNSFFRTAIEYGFFVMAFLIGFSTFACWSFAVRCDYCSLAICVLFAIFFSFDPTMLSAFFNPVLFYAVNGRKDDIS